MALTGSTDYPDPEGVAAGLLGSQCEAVHAISRNGEGIRGNPLGSRGGVVVVTIVVL